MAQEMMLLSLVNTNMISQDLVLAFEGGNFFNFGFFDLPFVWLRGEYQGEVGYNALDNNFQNHPTLSGKMFLVNIRADGCFSLVSVLGYAVCFLLGRWVAHFRKMADSFLLSGLIYTIQASFIDAVLCSLVQLAYVRDLI